MAWLVVAVIALAAVVVYVALVNQALLRCPYCGKVGAWRFDAIGTPSEEVDEDGHVVRSMQRQRCRRCGGEVDHVWSDLEGREIRRTDGRPAEVDRR